MKADLEVRLIHDGRRWIASHSDFEVSGHTLRELDEELALRLAEGKLFPGNAQVRVFMVFDYSCIPTWIRQYAYHYFNRYTRLDLKSPVPEVR